MKPNTCQQMAMVFICFLLFSKPFRYIFAASTFVASYIAIKISDYYLLHGDIDLGRIFF